jgi:chemosensory pili system protein ChpA (sensor histidine kinase/response regulator)
MQPDQQQRIMGYFIEEAKDHLNTIEQGLLNLQSTIEDSEMVNEVFRAAHSVKGGAAMLGLNGIQRVSHRMEDFFKVLKETPVPVDQKLENLFLRAFDALQELLGQLQGPFGLTEEVSNQIVAGVEPTFVELEQHLNQLAGSAPVPPLKISVASGQHLDSSADAVEHALEQLFRNEVPLRLREMLQLFKQPETDVATRQQLQELCRSLSSMGEQYQLHSWCQLVETARRAIAHSDNSYRILAPIVIRDIKLAQELVLVGRTAEITPCSQLSDLVPAPVETIVQDDLADLLGLTGDVDADASLDLTFDDLVTTADALDLSDDFAAELTETSAGVRQGPEVGSAELNSLADLFEGEMPELGLTWQQEEILTDEADLLTAEAGLTPPDDASDFADLLFESSHPSTSETVEVDDLGALFGDDLDDMPTQAIAPPSLTNHKTQPDDDFADLLGITDSSSTASADLDFNLDTATDPFQTDLSDLADANASDFGDAASLPGLNLDEMSDMELDGALGDLGDLFDGLNETDIADANTVQPASVPLATDPWATEPVADLGSDLNTAAIAASSELDFGDLDLDDLETNLLEDSAIADSSSLDADLNADFSLDFSGADDLDFGATDLADLSLLDEPAIAPSIDQISVSDQPSDSDAFADLLNLDQESNLSSESLDSSLDDLLSSDPSPESLDSSFDDLLGSNLSPESLDSSLDDLLGNDPSPENLDSSLDDLLGTDPSPENLDSSFDDLLGNELSSESLDSSLDNLLGTDPSPENLDSSFDDLLGNELSSESLDSSLDNLLGTDPSPENLDSSFDDLLSIDLSSESLDSSFDDLLGQSDNLDLAEIDATSNLDESLLGDLSESDSEQVLDLAGEFGLTQETELSEIGDPWDDTNLADSLIPSPLTLETPEADAEVDRLFDPDASITESELESALDWATEPPELTDATDTAIAFPEGNPATELNSSADLELSMELDFGNDEIDAADLFDGETDLFNDSTATSADNPPHILETWLQPEEASLDFSLDLLETSEAATANEIEIAQPLFEAPDQLFAEPLSATELSDMNELLDMDGDSAAIADLTDAELFFETALPDLDAEQSATDFNLSDAGAIENFLTSSEDLWAVDSPDLGSLSDLDIDSLGLEEASSSEVTAEPTNFINLDLDAPLETSADTPLDADLENEIGDLLDISAASELGYDQSLDDLDQLLNEPADEGYAGNDQNLENLDQRLSESANEIHAGSEFDDLENLLGEDSSTMFADFNGLMDAPSAESFASAQSFTSDFATDSSLTDAGVDDFSDLESLLANDVLEQDESHPSSPNSAIDESEFDDLNDLLKDAEEKMGGSPTMKVGSGVTPGRRSPRPGRVFSEQTMRVPVKHLDNLSNLVGELVVNRNSLEQDQERLRQSLDNLLYQVQQLSDVGQRMQDLYERSLLESSLLASRQGYRSSPLHVRSGDTTIVESPTDHHSGVEYDPLEMDRFTGFHSLSQEMIELIVRVRESSSDIEFIVDETEQVTRMFRQVTTQLQEGLTRSRMVPFAQTADRLPRAVRDISMKVGKQAELIIEGRETLIDKMILEQLYDPMTHLVNNAITHGIEDPAVRLAAGKPAVGRITIRAFHQGNQTILSVADDGAGIDIDRVKAKAVEKGLISAEEVRTMSRLDMYDILFHPGFSTKDQADDFSGRGVGMDVVRTSLSEIRGVINTDSTPGRGTSFTIRLPLTLSISKALCCISDRARIAFPMDGVEDMLDVPKERIQTNAENQPCIAWRDTILTVRPLSELLGYNRHLSRGNVYGGNQEDDMVSIVVLRSAGNFLALQVDQVMGEQEIVIKQLEGPVPKPIGVAGATVLGDGRIMPIADVLELIDLSVGRLRRDAGGSLWEQEGGGTLAEAPAAKTEPMVLIVDDSITVRELLSMTFNKVGYRVEQARDGQEAWEKLRSGLPCDIVFCDIEMPRMDGLELLSRIQKDVNLKHLPIAMLTSRGADRHRQMAASLGASGYFTKPYLEEALLDAAQRMLKGERLLHSS